jgi:hypothetical protein
MYRQGLQKGLMRYANDPSSANIIFTILKEHNEQVEISKDRVSFDVGKLKDKTITTLNKFLML